VKIIALVRSELQRLTSTGLARLALVALMTVPLLYGGLYLWANQDPYAKLDQVPAAIVNADVGTVVDGTATNYGDEVTDEVVDGGDFDWHAVSAAQAAAGLRDGTYDFTFSIPSDFSADLVSASSDDPTRAQITLATNDANSYLSTTIAGQAGKTIRASVTEKVGEEAAKQLLVGLADIRTSLGSAVDGADQLVSGTVSATDGADQLVAGASDASAGADRLSTGASDAATGADSLAAGTAQLATGATTLSSGLDRLETATSGLPASTRQLAAGAQQVAEGDRALADALGPVAEQSAADAAQIPTETEVKEALLTSPLQLTDAQATALAAQISGLNGRLSAANDQVQALNGQVGTLADGAEQVSAGAAQLSAAAPALASGVADAADGAGQLETGAASAASGASTLATGLDDLDTGAASLASGLNALDEGSTTLRDGVVQLRDGTVRLRDGLQSGLGEIPASTEQSRGDQASAISDPVAVSDRALTSAGTYGAGLAPFFISLAAWIGIYALFLIVKPLSKRAVTAVKAPVRIVTAGWLAPALLGVVQMVALFAVVRGALGFDVAHPWGMVGLMALASVTFAAIIMMLNVLLGSVGQFLGLVLMVVQLVTAGGTFPWQTLPGPLAALHFVLPMSYATDGLRQLMYGGSTAAAWTDAGVLALWMLGALLVSLLATARMTRRRTLRDLRPSLIG